MLSAVRSRATGPDLLDPPLATRNNNASNTDSRRSTTIRDAFRFRAGRGRMLWGASCLFLAAGIGHSLTGCSNRPSPTAVVKDGNDDDPPPVNVVNRPNIGAVNREGGVNREGNPGAGANPAAQAAQGGRAPFETSLLPPDSELILYAQMDQILRSSLVQDVMGGDLQSFGNLVANLGVHPGTVESIRIGIRKLDDVPIPSPQLLAGGLASLSLMDLAVHPDVQSTIVIRSSDRIDESTIAVNSERIAHENELYYRLNTNQFVSPCAYIVARRSLVVSDERTIRSLIEAGRNAPRPTADLRFVRRADFVVAMVPKNRESLQRWLPTLPSTEEQPKTSTQQQDQTSLSDNTPAAAGEGTDAKPSSDEATPSPAGSPAVPKPTVVRTDKPVGTSAEAASPLPTQESESGSSNSGSPGDDSASSNLLSDFREHALGIAFQMSLQDGVSMSVSAHIDTPEAPDELKADLELAIDHWKEAFEEQRENLPGGFGELVDALRVDAQDSLAYATSSIPAPQQADVLQLPGFLLGLAVGSHPDLMEQASSPSSPLEEPPRELAERTLVEGIPPLASPDRPDGLELRTLARWKPSSIAGNQSRELQLAVVAFGGPAVNAAALGHLHLETAEVNRLAPLKWLGASHHDDTYGYDPIYGFVPIDRDNPLSVHPPNGVIAVFDVVPPAEPTTSLRRIAGQFTLRYFNVADEIVIANIRQNVLGGLDNAALQQAGIDISLGRGSGNETIEVFYDESAGVGTVELIRPDGSPVAEAEVSKTASQSKVLRSLSVETATLPEDLGLRIALKSDVQHLVVPFDFPDLPVPDISEFSDSQQALLVWTPVEPHPSHPEGLLIEAQARWDNPAAGPLSNAPIRRRRLSRDDDEGYVGTATRRSAAVGRGNLRRTGASGGRPLRVLVDLTGPQVESADAVGYVAMTSIATDFGSELPFEGAYFRQEDPSGEYISRAHNIGITSDGPPGGIRIAFHFTPPLEPLNFLARFNGSLKLRRAINRIATVIPNLHDRLENRIVNRELSQRGVSLVADIENDEVMVRIVEGRDEQISAIVAVDAYGDPIPGVTMTTEVGKGNADNRLIHRLSFASGVPSSVGLRLFVNSGVNEVTIPFRFNHVPVPPIPGPATYK